MDPPCKWYPLPVFSGLPALFVSARFGESSYTLHVTDLANIWVEKLDRRGILYRSLQENTSIDLVDAGAEQWSVFLSKLEAALDPASSNHHLTSISLAANSQSKSHDDLTLHVTCELPKPLAALKWPIHLTKCQSASLVSELVLPLIRTHYAQRQEAETLMNQLRDKDALITKLVDKLATMQTPLELIFNSLSAKHAITRGAAEERVKGLAPFNEKLWRSQQNLKHPQDAPALLHSVFRDTGLNLVMGADLDVSDTLNDWWTRLGSGLHASSKTKIYSPPPELKWVERDNTPVSADIDNEDFQVQVTPARRTSRSPTGAKSVASTSTENSESDVPDSQTMRLQNSRRSRVGTLGNKKMPSQGQPTSQSSQTLHTNGDDTVSESEIEGQPVPSKRINQANKRLGTIGQSGRLPQPVGAATAVTSPSEANDETASGSDSESDGPKGVRPLKSAPTTPRKGELGRIGGTSKGSTGPENAPGKPKLNATKDESASPKKTEVRKIGAIGKGSHKEPKRTHPDTPAEPEEVETDEQKAERKRAELARELNQRTSMPGRKKRKF